MARTHPTRFYGSAGGGLRRARLLSRRKEGDLHLRQMKSAIRQIGVLLAVVLLAQATQLHTAPKPAPAPARWMGLIGEYGPDSDILYILEKDGKLCASFKRAEPESLAQISQNVFVFSVFGPHANQQLVFTRDRRGRGIRVQLNETTRSRRQIEPEAGANQ